MTIEQAYRLAGEIEIIHAKERAALVRSGRRGWRETWQNQYDPHAATELAELIYARAKR